MPTNYWPNGYTNTDALMWGNEDAAKLYTRMPDGTVRWITNADRASATEDLIWNVDGSINMPNYAIVGSTYAGLPVAGVAGRLRRVTDKSRGLWLDTGSTWYSLAGEVFDAGSFNAVGDGVTDDRAAIQAAIDAAYDAGGGTVLLPKGTFLLNGRSLVLKSNVTLAGSGYASVLTMPSGATAWDTQSFSETHDDSNGGLIVTPCGASNVRVTNLRIVGSKTTQRTPGSRPTDRYCPQLINPRGRWNTTLVNPDQWSASLSGGYGEEFLTNVKIDHCWFESHGGNAIWPSNQLIKGFRVTDCYFYDIGYWVDVATPDMGAIQASCWNGLIANNYFEKVDLPVAASGTRITISGNTIYDCRSGIGSGDSANCDNVIIADNTMTFFVASSTWGSASPYWGYTIGASLGDQWGGAEWQNTAYDYLGGPSLGGVISGNVIHYVISTNNHRPLTGIAASHGVVANNHVIFDYRTNRSASATTALNGISINSYRFAPQVKVANNRVELISKSGHTITGGYVYGLLALDSSTPAWAPTTAYALGDVRWNDSGKRYVCTQAGTSAGAGGPTGTGTAIVDNTVRWDYEALPNSFSATTVLSLSGNQFANIPNTGVGADIYFSGADQTRLKLIVEGDSFPGNLGGAIRYGNTNFAAGSEGPFRLHYDSGTPGASAPTWYRQECPGWLGRGAGTIASGTTSLTVTHGLWKTPAHIDVIPTENATNDHGPIYITAAGSTQFTVNVRSDPGASGLDFIWSARTA